MALDALYVFTSSSFNPYFTLFLFHLFSSFLLAFSLSLSPLPPTLPLLLPLPRPLPHPPFIHPRFGGYILAGLKRKFLKVNNFSFSYYERPPNSLKNKPTTLLFLHGLTSNKESWVRVTQYLPNSWRILVLDMPGHGESSFDSKLDYSPFGMAMNIHMVYM